MVSSSIGDLDVIADTLANKLLSTGFTVNIRQSIDKHPLQNADLNLLVGELSSRGLLSRFRNRNQSIDDRDILIVYDGLPTLRRAGMWDELMTSSVRYVVTIHTYEEDDFEGDFVLDHTSDELQIWKRIKVRI